MTTKLSNALAPFGPSTCDALPSHDARASAPKAAVATVNIAARIRGRKGISNILATVVHTCANASQPCARTSVPCASSIGGARGGRRSWRNADRRGPRARARAPWPQPSSCRFASVPGQKIVHDDICPADETAQQGLIVRLIKICGDAHLVAIAAEVIRALAARIERRTPSAALVAGSR